MLLRLVVLHQQVNSINIELIRSQYNEYNTIRNNNKRKQLLGNNNSTISDVILIDNNESENYKKNYKNIIGKNNNKNLNKKIKDIYLRKLLLVLGFKTVKHFVFMMDWIKSFWRDDIFTNKLSFNKKDFLKRVIIQYKENNENKIINLNDININNINKNGTLLKKLILLYPNLKLLLKYINESDENRKKFNIWVTGSMFNDEELKIILQNEIQEKPYSAHTCFNFVDVYKTNENINKNMLEMQINIDISKPEFSD